MKNIIQFCLGTVLLIIVVSCTEDDEAGSGAFLNVSPSSDLVRLGESVSFTVVNENGNDVTSQAEITVNGASLPSNVFTPDAIGTLSVSAFVGDFGQTIEVDVIENINQLNLSVSTDTIKLSGEDQVEVSVVDENGANVLGLVSLFLNGELTTDSIFTSTELGILSFSATYFDLESNSENVVSTFIPESLTITASVMSTLAWNRDADMVAFTCLDEDDFDCTEFVTFQILDPMGSGLFEDLISVEDDMATNVWKTSIPETYSFRAVYEMIVSDTVDVVATPD